MVGTMDTPLRTLPQKRARYEVLDGLRGIAAILVVCFHLFEAHATSHFAQMINHACLAVDFFFVLSGFVIGYAYDGRWATGELGSWGFIRRRLIRLQPMIVLGTLLGLAVFPFTFMAEGWEGQASLGAVLLCSLLGALMIPITPALDVRGWDENYPLNGSQWSLFFEYAANLLYVLVLRFLPTRWLALATLAAGALSAWYVFTSSGGDYWQYQDEPRRHGCGSLFLCLWHLQGILPLCHSAIMPKRSPFTLRRAKLPSRSISNTVLSYTVISIRLPSKAMMQLS